MAEEFLNNTAIHTTASKRVSKMAQTRNQNNLPNWFNLQTIMSVLTLIGMVVGFFVQNAVQQERSDRLKQDFDIYKIQLDKLSQQNNEIKLELAKQQGIREAEKEKRK